MDLPFRLLPLLACLALAGPAAAAVPTLTTISDLTGGNEDIAVSIPFATLKDASNAADTDGDTISFRVKSINGTLRRGGNTIAAHAGTQAVPTALAANTWGYRVVGVGGFGASAYSAETNNTSSTSTWAGMPATGSPNTLKTTSSTAANDVTTVWYGVKVDSSQPNGVYSDTVTYTATTN